MIFLFAISYDITAVFILGCGKIKGKNKRSKKMRKLTEKHLSDFRAYLVEEEKSKSTVDKYLRDLKAFYAFFGNRRIEKADVLAYKLHLSETYAVSSVNSHISSINSFFTYRRSPGYRPCPELRIHLRCFPDKWPAGGCRDSCRRLDKGIRHSSEHKFGELHFISSEECP